MILMKISDIQARQILDSRGYPTVEVDVWLEGNVFGRAAVPSGASTGTHEAIELRDEDQSDYQGKSVHFAVNNVHEKILPALRGMSAEEQAHIDQVMRELDGTPQKSNLGANAILAVSLACAHAAAKAKGVLLYSHINDLAGKPEKSLPMPMMNLLNGGKHAEKSTAIQEWMLIPKASSTMAEAVETGANIFHSLKQLMSQNGYPTSVGDEGGFTMPIKKHDTEALIALSEACQQVGKIPGSDVAFAIDVAASEILDGEKYHVNSDKSELDQQEMIDYLAQLSENFPVISIEDGLAEDDWDGWQKLTARLGDKVQIVGDDLLVTDIGRVKRAIHSRAVNAVLVKPNQIGTLSETLEVIAAAKRVGFNTIVSHRSGETEDVSIVHIAVGAGAGQIKTGSLSRSERTAKYNELLRLEALDPTLQLAQPF